MMKAFHDACTSTQFQLRDVGHDCNGSPTVGPCVHDGPWSPYEGTALARDVVGRVADSQPRVLLLLAHTALTRVAIDRAADVVAALDGELHVLMRVPAGVAVDHPALLTSEVGKLVARRMRDRPFDFELVAGNVVDVCTSLAKVRRFSMIVVDGAFAPADACRLVSTLRVPVLVARNERDDGEVVAASDLRHSELPVLTVARQFASPLQRDVTFLHNAAPLHIYAADPVGCDVSFHSLVEQQDDLAVARHARLRNLAGNDPHVRTMLTRAPSTVDAIVGAARERNADVIAVGHRRRSWFSRLFGRDIAERVVARARRSVLLVPLTI